MQTKDGLDFLCKDKFGDTYFDDKSIGHKFIWCDQCYDSFNKFKDTVFKNHKILLKEIDSEIHIAEIVENKYSAREKFDEERVRALPPIVFDTNDLGW
jgi:hypothetical protein